MSKLVDVRAQISCPKYDGRHLDIPYRNFQKRKIAEMIGLEMLDKGLIEFSEVNDGDVLREIGLVKVLDKYEKIKE